MALQIKVFSNCGDAFIVWRSAVPINDCIGFELWRIQNGTKTVVNNRVSFVSGTPDLDHPTSSTLSPLRRYTWTDHGNHSGDQVAYQVVPVIAPGSSKGAPDASQASPVSNSVTIGGKIDANFECYFNRGIVLSQFMARFLNGDESDAALKKFKDSLNADPDGENKIRSFLGGQLRDRLLALLKAANANGQHVYTALYELSDNLLIEQLKALGKRAHIVLSNGTHKAATDDGNQTARAALQGCDIHNRMLASGHLGHNKFAAFADPGTPPKPSMLWSGSTNWSPTGLCTQMNNGILLHDQDVAQIYVDHWTKLRDAGDDTPPAMITDNNTAKKATVGTTPVEVWFTRTSGAPEMTAVNQLVAQAKQGVLFLMFEPGSSSIENAILKLKNSNADLFVKGVISTMDQNDTTAGSVTLVQRGDMKIPPLEVVQPAGLDQDVTGWAAEVSRQSFLKDIGFAIVHSKVVVIDPNGSDPVVVTGSHNFSASATQKNDENLLIIRGNAALAKAYSVCIQSIYDHYEFRAVAKLMESEGKSVVNSMKDPKGWQPAWFKGDRKLELEFWLA
jgi:phosphatidylserine/phosphatidylglycerophosphate/cardiolipin synthase-like enzyme